MRSEQIQAEGMLMSAVLTTALDAVVVTDVGGAVVGWNAVAEEMFGWPQEDALGRELGGLIIPQSLRQQHADGMARYVATSEPHILGRRIETTGLRRDGSEFPVELSVVESLEGGKRLFLGFIRDLSQRKEAEAAAIEWQAVSAAAQGINQVGIWQYHPDTGSISWSDQVYRVFGLAPGSVAPTFELIQSLVHEEDRPELLRQFELGLAGRNVDYEHRTISAEGEVRYLRVRGEWVKPGAGRPERLMGVIQDITDHKNAQAVISSQAAALKDMHAKSVHESRERAMGTMAATLAHELNQPLTAITNYASALRRTVSPEPGSAVETGIRALQDNAVRAGEIIRRMRGLARQGEVVKEPVCLDELIRESISFLESTFGPLPLTQSGGHEKRIPGDRIQLQQVLVNLMRNACEAVRGCENPQVEVSCCDVAGAVRVAVSDNGEGIPANLLPRIFEANVSTKPDGMGIGLSICRTIIEAHGGTISAESEGRGSCFSFTIPAG